MQTLERVFNISMIKEIKEGVLEMCDLGADS